MKICPKCGFDNLEYAVFCEECGERLSENKEEKDKSAVAIDFAFNNGEKDVAEDERKATELRARIEEEVTARFEAEEAERQRREAEEAERQRREAEEAERQRREAEEAERQRKEAEEAERQRREAEEAERQRREAEEAERQRREVEEAECKAAERRARIEAEVIARIEAEERAEQQAKENKTESNKGVSASLEADEKERQRLAKQVRERRRWEAEADKEGTKDPKQSAGYTKVLVIIGIIVLAVIGLVFLFRSSTESQITTTEDATAWMYQPWETVPEGYEASTANEEIVYGITRDEAKSWAEEFITGLETFSSEELKNDVSVYEQQGDIEFANSLEKYLELKADPSYSIFSSIGATTVEENNAGFVTTTNVSYRNSNNNIISRRLFVITMDSTSTILSFKIVSLDGSEIEQETEPETVVNVSAPTEYKNGEIVLEPYLDGKWMASTSSGMSFQCFIIDTQSNRMIGRIWDTTKQECKIIPLSSTSFKVSIKGYSDDVKFYLQSDGKLIVNQGRYVARKLEDYETFYSSDFEEMEALLNQ